MVPQTIGMMRTCVRPSSVYELISRVETALRAHDSKCRYTCRYAVRRGGIGHRHSIFQCTMGHADCRHAAASYTAVFNASRRGPESPWESPACGCADIQNRCARSGSAHLLPVPADCWCCSTCAYRQLTAPLRSLTLTRTALAPPSKRVKMG